MTRTRRRWDFNSRFLIGQPGNPMLQRWRLIQTPMFGIYLHFIFREDLDRAPHDHPWTFWSVVLRGGYSELLIPDARLWRTTAARNHGRCSLHHFPLRAAHRIVAVKPGTITLVLVGRKQRTWGFYNAGHFTDYRDALHLRPRERGTQKYPLTAVR